MVAILFSCVWTIHYTAHMSHGNARKVYTNLESEITKGPFTIALGLRLAGSQLKLCVLAEKLYTKLHFPIEYREEPVPQSTRDNF